MWHRGVVFITTAQLNSSKPDLRFCEGSNPARGVSEIRDGDDLWQWSHLEIRLRFWSVNYTTETILSWSSSLLYVSDIGANSFAQFQLGASNSEKDKYLKKRKNTFWNQYEIVQYEIREDENLRGSSQS